MFKLISNTLPIYGYALSGGLFYKLVKDMSNSSPNRRIHPCMTDITSYNSIFNYGMFAGGLFGCFVVYWSPITILTK